MSATDWWLGVAVVLVLLSIGLLVGAELRPFGFWRRRK